MSSDIASAQIDRLRARVAKLELALGGVIGLWLLGASREQMAERARRALASTRKAAS